MVEAVIPGAPSARRWRWWLLLVTGVVLAALAVVWWTHRPTRVDAIPVRFAPMVQTLQFSARVAALSRVDIGSTVTARVTQVLVQEGSVVHKDQELVRLESAELLAALAQAQAVQQQAAARLAGLRSTGRAGVGALQTQAQAAVDAATAEYARTEQLVAQGFLSPARLDEARRVRDSALAQLAAARASSQAVADTGTDMQQAQAQLRSATATSEAARARLAQTSLLAPAPGKVLVRQVEPGQIVQPGRFLLALALDGPTQIVAQVDERFLRQLAVGQQATAVADAFAGQRFGLRLLSIAPLVDAQRGAVEVKFALEQAAPAFLRQDMSLSLEVETARRERALAVPVAALASGVDSPGASLRVVHEGRVVERAVRLGLRTLDAVEVVEGLAEGDLLVVDKAVPVGRRVRVTLVPAALGMGARPVGSGESGAAALTNAMGR